MFLNFFAYGKFGSHGRFAIYWISRNNGPRCIGATLYIAVYIAVTSGFNLCLMQYDLEWEDPGCLTGL